MSGFFITHCGLDRPRLAGERLPSGRLRTGATQKSRDAGPVLTIDQGIAARHYARKYRRAQASPDAAARIDNGKALGRARTALTAAQIAVMDMVAGREISLGDLARKTGRTIADLTALFIGACDRLAVHYSAQVDA